MRDFCGSGIFRGKNFCASESFWGIFYKEGGIFLGVSNYSICDGPASSLIPRFLFKVMIFDTFYLRKAAQTQGLLNLSEKYF